MKNLIAFFPLLFCLILAQSCSLFRLGAFNGPSPNQNPADPTAGIYVSTNGNDTNSGITPESPVLSIQTAISNAVVHGYTNIYIQSGVYSPGNGLNTSENGILISNQSLALLGGYDSSFSNRTGRSELTGENSLYHVFYIYCATNVLFDRLTIRYGNANSISDGDKNGGAIEVTNCRNVRIQNTVISNNRAENYGGGLHSYRSANITLSNVQISENTAAHGGGIFLEMTAGISLQECIFLYNNASLYGGGYYNYFSRDIELISSSLVGNTAGYDGGGMLSYNSTNIDIRDCAINYNSSGDVSAIYNIYTSRVSITGCAVTNNSGSLAVVYFDVSTFQVVLSNNIIGGTNGSTAYAIYEKTSDTTNQVIVGNTILTDTVANLYYDIGLASAIPCSPLWTNINSPYYTGAAVAYGNSVQ